MKRIVLGVLLFISAVFAQKATLVEVISENMIKVQHDDGTYQRLQLVGIELFSKANNATRAIDLDTKDRLKKETISYIKTLIKTGDKIKYFSVNHRDSVIQKVWLDNHELNYKLVRDGYAVVTLNDYDLPTKFKMRMTMAMKYAKQKRFGLWNNKANNMMALIDTDKHMCGWSNKKNAQMLSQQSVLKELQEALPKKYRMQTQLLAVNTH